MCGQNEANVWYFNSQCGLDFNSGVPMVLEDGQTRYGFATSTISDSLGNFLFCSDYGFIYTKNGIMDNGSDMPATLDHGLIIVKWPGKEGLYYLFTAADQWSTTPGLYYSLIDLKANDGLGSVVEKNIYVEAGWDVSCMIAAVKKDDSEYVWILVRKNEPPAFAAFLIDENGLNLNPVVSEVPLEIPYPYWKSETGQIKVSPDKSFLVAKHVVEIGFEICRFSSITGAVEYMYSLRAPNVGGIWTMEFSPDSKYLYQCVKEDDQYFAIYQYDMQFISDSVLFKNSAIMIGSGNASDLQIARDGKIYCSANWQLPETNQHFISVIHNPWIRGAGCMFENNAIYLGTHKNTDTFPDFLVDYLLRFEWEGEQCQNYPIHFKPNFIPTPQTIQWDFDDGPGSNSWQLSPTYR